MDTAKGKVTVAITAASYSGNKGAAAMLQSSIARLKQAYGTRLHIYLMSVYPAEDRTQCTHECAAAEGAVFGVSVRGLLAAVWMVRACAGIAVKK